MAMEGAEGSGDCVCGHRWNRHHYWQEDGFNSGACYALKNKCPCVIYHDTEWEEVDEPEVRDEDWDLI